MQVPILWVNYSRAPESAFPQALNECVEFFDQEIFLLNSTEFYVLMTHARTHARTHRCFYAYAWALANLSSLGTPGEFIALCGDSAGSSICCSSFDPMREI